MQKEELDLELESNVNDGKGKIVCICIVTDGLVNIIHLIYGPEGNS